MKFTKMHGIGNDYVYINGFEETINNPAALAVKVSDRHFGIGSDGLIMILPSDIADVRMRMFNADGSEGRMCGNGVRCVAKYAHDHGLSKNNPLRVETLAGIKIIELELDDNDKVQAARVDMGTPGLSPQNIPAAIDGEKIINSPVDALDKTYEMTCVSMGNPHMIIYTDDVAAVELDEIGPVLENLPIFPERINVHFVQVVNDGEVVMRTWERGSGITWACGTGASAVCVAGVLTGRSGRKVLVHLPGGDLKIEWNEENNHVFMTGPATEVFSGEWLGGTGCCCCSKSR
ncbi:MAG TPA: diaminopimelate epimerase [Phycisphaerae bacterium]|nr:diaminopimelate epimerase [Phycisphaerae bacterium]